MDGTYSVKFSFLILNIFVKHDNFERKHSYYSKQLTLYNKNVT